MSDNIVHTTDDGFDQDVLKADKPVLWIIGLNGADRAK